MSAAESRAKFPTLDAAFKAALLMDYKTVLEYRVVYNPPDDKKGEAEYWTVKRKIMQRFAFGQPKWIWL